MAHLVLSRVMDQVLTPGMGGIRFILDIICGSWAISAACSGGFFFFGLQLPHCFNTVATEALMKSVIIAAENFTVRYCHLAL